MSKLTGTSGLRIRQVPSKEWGIWRVNEDGLPYLILTFPTIEEAIEVSVVLKEVLGLSCPINRSEFY